MSFTWPDLPASGDLLRGATDWTQGLSLPPGIMDIIGAFWDPATKEVGGIMNHALEERSYIDFQFPNLDLPGAARGRRRVCFFENPDIVESRAPNYAVTPIVQRNEPARLFVGANARKINLSFTHTFPHLVDYAFACNANLGAGFGGTRRAAFQAWIKQAVEAQIVGGRTASTSSSIPYPVQTNSESGEVTFRPKNTQGPRWVVPAHNDSVGDWDETITFPGTGYGLNKGNQDLIAQLLESSYGFAQNDYGVLAAAYIHYTMDTIRASVVGDYNERLSAGPPIVRLHHGTSFLGEPYVVTNYQIEFDNLAGTDPRTLIPRQVKFRLSLEEMRQTRGASTKRLPGSTEIMSLVSDDRVVQIERGGQQSLPDPEIKK